LNARELCKLADVNIEAEVTGGEASSAVPLHFIEQACANIAPRISHLGTCGVGRVCVCCLCVCVCLFACVCVFICLCVSM
jgi:hypothetical protein